MREGERVRHIKTGEVGTIGPCSMRSSIEVRWDAVGGDRRIVFARIRDLEVITSAQYDSLGRES